MSKRNKRSSLSGIYLDNAAGTRMSEEVFEEMRPYMLANYGNPASQHSLGRTSRNAMEDARRRIAGVLKCSPDELYFTSGGTESNNWAIKGAKYDLIISSAVEHPSVTNAVLSTGATHVELPVDGKGMVDLVLLEDTLSRNRGRKVLVSVQHANSETGTIQRVQDISSISHKYGAVFHTDAVQSFCKFDWQVLDIGADMVSISARKIHGPSGIGALYVRKGVDAGVFMHGGGQERGMRSGTPDVASIVGFAKASEMTGDYFRRKGKWMRRQLDWLHHAMDGYFEGVTRNGNADSMLPNILNMTICDIDSELVCAILDSEFNLMCSTGSACSSASGPSKVLVAMGKKARSSLRMSMGVETTDDDICFAYEYLAKAMRKAEEKLI